MSAITDQVQAMETQAAQFRWKLEAQRYVGILMAAVIYAIGFNFFLAPLHLYAGGFMGFAQLIAEQLKRITGFHFWDLELPGIIYYLMNVPWLIMGYRMMRRRFIIKTFFAITSVSVLLTLIPVAPEPILHEYVANAFFAGLTCGAGLGVILRMGACDGGMNLIGMIVVQKALYMLSLFVRRVDRYLLFALHNDTSDRDRQSSRAEYQRPRYDRYQVARSRSVGSRNYGTVGARRNKMERSRRILGRKGDVAHDRREQVRNTQDTLANARFGSERVRTR